LVKKKREESITLVRKRKKFEIPDGPKPKTIEEALEILFSVMGEDSRRLLKSFASEQEMVDFGFQMREQMRVRLGIIGGIKSPELLAQLPEDRRNNPDRAADFLLDAARRRLREEK
jgi:hypothetical protein